MDKTKKYSYLKYTISFVNICLLLLFLFIIYFSGVSNLLKELSISISKNRFGYVALYTIFLGLIYYLLFFFIHFYDSFILEHKFSLSNQGFKDWLKDETKGFILSFIIIFFLIESFYLVSYKFKDFWWIQISVLWITLSIILTKILPSVILPLFFKQTPVQDQNLKERILSLAKRLKIKILDVFEINLSRRSLKGNAGLVGLGKTKRVLISDTLKDRYTPQEIEVILAHEFAHYKLGHIFKHILTNSVFILLLFYLIFNLFKFLKLSVEDVVNLPILAISFIIIGVIFQPIQNLISRKFERNADLLSLRVTNDKESFISVMEKLANQNLSDRNPNIFIKSFFFDHPSIDERIKMAFDF